VRLLISVRDASEAAKAVAGGAEIVDAKEPDRGSVAAVSPAVLQAIRAIVPSRLQLSAALGDVARPEDVAGALARLPVKLSFVKLGFRGVREAGQVETLLAEAVARAALLPDHPAVIAVGYADHLRAGSLAPSCFPALISQAGAQGLLIDTCFKDAGALFDLLSPQELSGIGTELRSDELTFALGGSLRPEHMHAAADTGATVFGVRGAVCRGGRSGTIEEVLVRDLADAIGSERAPAAT
jgi:(5-formylfuran-3-yl)methyl phosphate synthase